MTQQAWSLVVINRRRNLHDQHEGHAGPTLKTACRTVFSHVKHVYHRTLPEPCQLPGEQLSNLRH